MGYLLAKYAFLFLLTAILSFLLGRWWARRNLVEVTESYESLTQSAALHKTQWESLWTRLDTLNGNIGASVRKEIDATPKAELPVFDLSGVETRLDAVNKKVENIHIPEPRETDLSGVLSELDGVGSKISAIRIPEAPTMPDLSPLSSRIAAVELAIKNLPRPEKPAPVDLAPVTGRISQLEDAVSRIPHPKDPVAVDLKPVNTKLRELELAVSRIPLPEKPRDINLQPIDRRLGAIEIELQRLRAIKAAPPPKPKKKKRPAKPKLFKSASHGKKDDLKKISGVGPKLERLLNRNGVYYFWQVSQWNKKDIDFIDARLQAFKGRISRDNWVSQAKKLKRESGAAKEPN